MAYNPFNIFRRNQKAIFAVLTIFIMFMFTLSSGVMGGDFFDWFPRWLAGKSRKGDVLATVDGDKIYAGELDNLRRQRVMANRFMSQASHHSQFALMGLAKASLPNLSPEGKRLVSSIEDMARTYGNNPQILQMLIGSQIDTILSSPTAKPEDKEAARQILAAFSLARNHSGPTGEHFFTNAPNATNKDLIDFILWQKKADQLGIKFTQPDIERMIQKEFYNAFHEQAQRDVRRDLQKQMSGFSIPKTIDAIGEEFRVRAAQVAVLGPGWHGRTDKTHGGFPAFSPAYDKYEYYREHTSPTTYGAIPISAANYLAQVPDPDENDPRTRDELLKLFDQYKDTEPNPGRETPGFKKPREIKVEWLGITGAEPYYVKLAEEQLQAGEIQAKVGSMMIAPVFGAIPGVTAPLVMNEPLLQSAYQQKLAQFQVAMAMGYRKPNVAFATDSALASAPLDSSIVRPGNMAAAAGALGGQLLGFGNPFAAAAKMVSGPMAYEIRDRAKAGVPAILMALGTIPAVGEEKFGIWLGKPVPAPLPGPALFGNLIGAVAAYELLLPRPLPIEAVKPELMKDMIRRQAQELAFGTTGNTQAGAPPKPAKKGDLQTFIEEVKKLTDNGKSRDKEKLAAAQKYISEFAAKRGLTLGKSTDLQTEWTLEDDPALAPLVAVQKESLKSPNNPHGSRGDYIPFANSFFWVAGDRRAQASGVYSPEYYPEQFPDLSSRQHALEPKPQYLVWRTEEVPAQSAKSYPAVKEQVKLAWKQAKARELAKARAEKMAEAIRAAGPNSESLVKMLLEEEAQKLRGEFPNDPKAQNRVAPFLVEGVAPLSSVPNPTASKSLYSFQPLPFSNALNPFLLVPSENVKYPSAAMQKTLMEERTKPVKTTFVLADEPKDTYYVATLLDRRMKSDDAFRTEVYAEDPLARMTGRGSPIRDAVLRNHSIDTQRKAFESVMALLKKEFKYEETEEQKKKLEESDRRGAE